jgi:hypothetical protein
VLNSGNLMGSKNDTIGADRGVAAVARSTPSGSASGPQQEQIAAIKGIARDAMKQYDLKSIIVRVTSGGKNVEQLSGSIA